MFYLKSSEKVDDLKKRKSLGRKMEGLPSSCINDTKDLHGTIQQYKKEGKWVYEQHLFWYTGYTYWDLHSEASDLFLHLSCSDLVIFKGNLNHRKLTYDCAAPASTPFDVAIGPMANAAGANCVISNIRMLV